MVSFLCNQLFFSLDATFFSPLLNGVISVLCYNEQSYKGVYASYCYLVLLLLLHYLILLTHEREDLLVIFHAGPFILREMSTLLRVINLSWKCLPPISEAVHFKVKTSLSKSKFLLSTHVFLNKDLSCFADCRFRSDGF